MSLFRKNTPTASSVVDLTKKAAVSLEKAGLAGQKAAVYLVLDHSGSMTTFYNRGDVQRLAEQALGLSANLDDDGTVPVIYFGSHAETPFDVRIDNHAGIIDRTHQRIRWGSTNYVAAMNTVADDYRRSAATDPALVIFQTDGEPNDRSLVERALRDLSSEPLFFAFVGFGGRVSFLEQLDTLDGRRVDNASFFHADDPRAVSDEDLYDGITGEFAQWLTAARTAGVLR